MSCEEGVKHPDGPVWEVRVRREIRAFPPGQLEAAKATDGDGNAEPGRGTEIGSGPGAGRGAGHRPGCASSLPPPELRYRAGPWMPGAGTQEEDLGLGYQPGTRDKGATHGPRLPELTQGMHDPERMSKAEPWDSPVGEGSGR